jgi:hypothetical protein
MIAASHSERRKKSTKAYGREQNKIHTHQSEWKRAGADRGIASSRWESATSKPCNKQAAR